MDCKQCKKTFKTASALKQHKATKHQNANRGAAKAGTAPVAKNNRTRTTKPKITTVNSGTRVVHSEAITINLAANGVSVSGQKDASPTQFDWLQTIADSYDKCHWNAFWVEYLPLLPTSNGGDVVVYFDVNSDGTPSDYSAAYAMEGAVSGRLWDTLRHHAKART